MLFDNASGAKDGRDHSGAKAAKSCADDDAREEGDEGNTGFQGGL
jgi:hypothetical protein